MNKSILILFCILLFSNIASSQTISDLVNSVNLDTLSLKVNEFSGEVPTVVNGNTVTILNRQHTNNDLAADYLKQQFMQLDNLTITDQVYSTNGRNIIATQIGKTNPNSVYIICAHYDSVTDYCADDNASGTVAILEIARILSTQCLDNTIVYALWDQEEIGLVGSNFYAQQAATNGDNILGVLNIDMMGYDGNDDNDFDIDVRDIANSIAMKDDILSVLNNPTYGFTLNVNVVNPGTMASDHARFWNAGFSAVLIGESWETNDRTPFYHSSGDRFSTFNLPYYHELTKLIMAYMATKAGLTGVDNRITATPTTLTSVQNSASYQWFNSDTDVPISGATNQSFSPTSEGTYAVEVSIGDCTERSDPYSLVTLGSDSFTHEEINVYPNPVINDLHIDLPVATDLTINLFDIAGKLVMTKTLHDETNTISLKALSKGIYFLNVKSADTSGNFKIVRE